MAASDGFAGLAAQIEGEVTTPADARWDEARQPWNLVADQRPDAVVEVASASDVAATVSFAAEAGLRVTAQGPGHGAATLGPLDGTLLIRAGRLDAIEVDPAARRARAGAGALWRPMMDAAGEHGLAALSGSSPDVGVVPYTLGGGVGWLSRPYGLASSLVSAAEVVTADGERRRVDAHAEPDLFWALRGGGGSFAVVTALEFGLLPLPEVYAGTIIFPADSLDVEAALRDYRDWARAAPREATSIARILTPPPVPDVPEPLRGRTLLTVGVCFVGDEGAGSELVAPLRELGEPLMDLVARIPVLQLVTIHLDPERPVPGITGHALVSELTDDAISAFAQAGPGEGSPLLGAELRHLGGAIAEPAAGGGALERIEAEFSLGAVGSPMAPGSAEPIARSLTALCEAMEPWCADGLYMNFAGDGADPARLFPPEVLERLRAVKSRWDPDGRIRGNHDILAAA